jgi:hypothetical protein
VVESNLLFRYGSLHIASLRGGEEGRYSHAFRTGPEVETKDCGEIDTPRGQFVTSGSDSCTDVDTPQKFVARRAEKFQEQGGRLCLATLELAYVFGGIAHAPRDVITNKMLPQARTELNNLEAFVDNPEAWGNGQGYWDDYCLCRLLEGVCERYLAYPVCGSVLPYKGRSSTAVTAPRRRIKR